MKAYFEIHKTQNMKKSFKLIGSLIICSVMMMSCAGDSMQADAKKLAKLYCENQHLLEKIVSGDESAIQESARLVEKSKSLSEELMDKYQTDEEK